MVPECVVDELISSFLAFVRNLQEATACQLKCVQALVIVHRCSSENLKVGDKRHPLVHRRHNLFHGLKCFDQLSLLSNIRNYYFPL